MKTFEFTFQDKTYRCALNRAILAELEKKNGLTLLNTDDILNKTYVLFYGSLKTNHPSMKYEEAVKLLDDMTAVDENGECEYDFVDIAKAVNQLAAACIESSKAKNQIKIG